MGVWECDDENVHSEISLSLSLPILSLQVYNASEDAYTFKDKYYGRSLSPDGFRQSLRDFLHNGAHLRTDIIPTLIDMLTRLREMLKYQDSFRFFSSSLLIMYNGSSPHSNCVYTGQVRSPSLSVETGCTCASGDGVMCGGVTNGDANGHVEVLDPNSTGHHHLHTSHLSSTGSFKEARKLVDVRMIDFAHTTHSKCEKDLVKYSGPDEGYILGLNTLISSFQEIYKEKI